MLAPAAYGGDWIPSGTRIPVQVSDLVHVRAAREDGRVFSGTVTADIFDLDGHLLIPKGSPAELRVRQIDRHLLALDLDSVSVNGRRYAVLSAETESEGVPSTGYFPWRPQPFAGGGVRVAMAVGPTADAGQGKSLNLAASSLLTFELKKPLEADIPDDGFQRDGHHYHYQ